MGIHWRHGPWETLAVTELFSVLYQHGVRVTSTEDDTPVTEVLQRCRCGRLRTITLDGHWTLEQVRGGA